MAEQAQTDQTQTQAEQAKQQAVLMAALDVFARYGFRRTSMEDIARAAGMSRPALYQYFRNKDAIGRALVAGYFDSAAQDVAQALAGPGSVAERLDRAFAAKAGPMIAQILDSPHGQEMLDAKVTMAADLVDAGMARMADVFAQWLEAEAQAGRVHLNATPQATAAMLLRALDGIKQPPYAQFEQERRALAALLGRGLATEG